MRRYGRIVFSIFVASVTVGVTPAAAQVAPAAAGSERVIVVRTTEDANIPAVPPGCPFTAPNVRLGATVWSFQTAANGGGMVNDQARQLGTASACGKITAPLVPFTQVPFYIEFDITEGFFVAQGFCTVTSNNVPTAGIILAGCTLTAAPSAGVVGGSVNSNSVFNPLHLPGFDTGSIWTLRLYSE